MLRKCTIWIVIVLCLIAPVAVFAENTPITQSQNEITKCKETTPGKPQKNISAVQQQEKQPQKKIVLENTKGADDNFDRKEEGFWKIFLREILWSLAFLSFFVLFLVIMKLLFMIMKFLPKIYNTKKENPIGESSSSDCIDTKLNALSLKENPIGESSSSDCIDTKLNALSLKENPIGESSSSDCVDTKLNALSFQQDFDSAYDAYEQKKYTISFPVFKRLSDEGFTRAYFYLGLSYEFGMGVSVNIAEAERYYRQSVDAADHGGVYRLGMLYRAHGQYRQAYEIYQRAIDGNFPSCDAYLEVAKILETGRGGVPRDIKKAATYYRLVAESNIDPFARDDAHEALERLGLLYRREDFDMDLPADLLSADANRLYRIGEGKIHCIKRDRDIPYAFVCLRAAADKGHVLAACQLSRIYANVAYPIFDGEKSKKYAEIAFNGMKDFVIKNPSYAGDAGYAYQYGIGNGNICDLNKAIDCYRIGISIGDKHSEWRLGEILFDQDQSEEAFKLLVLASEHGQGMAMYKLAQCFEKGIGTTVNMGKAIYWYERCANSHYAAEMDARQRLKDLRINIS